MRITQSILEEMASSLTELAAPDEFFIGSAYGGYALCQRDKKHGKIKYIFDGGFLSARDLYNRIEAYIMGYHDCLKDNKMETTD